MPSAGSVDVCPGMELRLPHLEKGHHLGKAQMRREGELGNPDWAGRGGCLSFALSQRVTGLACTLSTWQLFLCVPGPPVRQLCTGHPVAPTRRSRSQDRRPSCFSSVSETRCGTAPPGSTSAKQSVVLGGYDGKCWGQRRRGATGPRGLQCVLRVVGEPQELPAPQAAGRGGGSVWHQEPHSVAGESQTHPCSHLHKGR